MCNNKLKLDYLVDKIIFGDFAPQFWSIKIKTIYSTVVVNVEFKKLQRLLNIELCTRLTGVSLILKVEGL